MIEKTKLFQQLQLVCILLDYTHPTNFSDMMNRPTFQHSCDWGGLIQHPTPGLANGPFAQTPASQHLRTAEHLTSWSLLPQAFKKLQQHVWEVFLLIVLHRFGCCEELGKSFGELTRNHEIWGIFHAMKTKKCEHVVGKQPCSRLQLVVSFHYSWLVHCGKRLEGK